MPFRCKKCGSLDTKFKNTLYLFGIIAEYYCNSCHDVFAVYPWEKEE